MEILVTGGAGFIGSHLVEWLLSQGHHVRIFDNLSTGSKDHVAAVRGATFIEGDIRDLSALMSAAEGVRYIFHLAAMVSVVQSIEQPIEAEQINALGSLHVLEAARHAGAQRVIMASSCAVYGNCEQLPITEKETADPLSPYAATKLAAECFGQLYSRLYEVEAVSLRFFNVYGPRQSPTSFYAAVVPRFIQALLDGNQPTIYGDGMQTRDLVYVGDIVQALWTVATSLRTAGTVLNVGSGQEVRMLDLAYQIGDLLNRQVQPNFMPARSGEVRFSRADPRRILQLTGFRPSTPLRDGLAATIKSLQS